MKFKANWPEAAARWTALWNGTDTDRPCITVCAPNGRQVEMPKPVSGEQYWLDPDFFLASMKATFESTYYGGEGFPSRLLMAGWVANTYGAVPHFPMDTIWFDPIAVDWDNPPTFAIDWESPWLGKFKKLREVLVATAGKDDLVIGQAAIMPGNDMLPLVIGSDRFLFALSDHPEWTRQAILQLARNAFELQKYFRTLAAATSVFPDGNCGWMPFWSPESYIAMQSDISCMLSPDMFDEFILPDLDLAGREFGHVWYHLDGQSAFHHLPRLLSLPYVKVIQFTPMAGTPFNGPDHLALYRKIQAAGKIVHIQVPRDNVEPLVRALDPRRLCIDTWCDSPGQAEELLVSAKRWTKGRNE